MAAEHEVTQGAFHEETSRSRTFRNPSRRPESRGCGFSRRHRGGVCHREGINPAVPPAAKLIQSRGQIAATPANAPMRPDADEKPTYVAETRDPLAYSRADNLFWNDITMEHAQFFVMLTLGRELEIPRRQGRRVPTRRVLGGAQMRTLEWVREPTRIRDDSYGPDEVHIRWFEDGVLNASVIASTGTCGCAAASPPSSERRRSVREARR